MLVSHGFRNSEVNGRCKVAQAATNKGRKIVLFFLFVDLAYCIFAISFTNRHASDCIQKLSYCYPEEGKMLYIVRLVLRPSSV